MLQQPIYSLFIRMIPEATLVLYSILQLTNTKADLKKVIVSGILGGSGVYMSRLLPVHFGVHTIFAIMLYIVLIVKLNKIEVHKAISTTLIAIIILFISDFILVLLYTEIFHFSSEFVFGQSWVSSLAGVPSLFMFYLIVMLIVFLKGKRIKYDKC